MSSVQLILPDSADVVVLQKQYFKIVFGDKMWEITFEEIEINQVSYTNTIVQSCLDVSWT